MKIGAGNDSIDLERLVRLVMNDLGVSENETPTSSVSPAMSGSVSSVPAAPVEKPSDFDGSDSSDAPLVIRLTGHVVTLDQIQKTAPVSALSVKKILVASGAVVTPSAKDEIRKRGLELVYDDSVAGSPIRGTSSPSIAGPSASGATFSLSASNVPFSAESGTRATLSASSAPSVRRRGETSGGAVRSASNAVPMENLILAFHALPLETIPKHFLETLQKMADVTLFRSDCVMTAADRLAESLANPKNKGIFLTAYSAIASAVCNRHRAIRGVVGYDLPQAENDAASLGANLLILDPDRAGFFRMRQMMTRFAALGVAECPAVVRKGLES